MRLIRAQAREAQRGGRTDGVVLMLVSLSALLRVFLPLVVPGLHDIGMAAGGATWSLAIFVALLGYGPRLFMRETRRS